MSAWSVRYLERHGREADHTYGPALNLSEAALLRLNAEERLRTQSPEAPEPRTESDIRKLAHDLCSPLVWISGYTRTVLKHNGGRLDALYHERLVEVVKGIEKMEQLVEALMDFSRQTMKPLHLTQANLSGMVKDIIAELKKQIRTERYISTFPKE